MRIRNRGGVPDNTYQWPERTGPPRVDWTSDNRHTSVGTVPDPPKPLPDVPLNVDPRYCTPAIDPLYVEEPTRQKRNSPQHFGRQPSLNDLKNINGERQTSPSPGSQQNPYVIQDDENAERHREARRQSEFVKNGTTPHTSRAARQSTDRSSRSDAGAAQSSYSASSRTTRGNASAGQPGPSEPPARGWARYRKTAADGFSPKTSSPLKKIAYQAPSPAPSPPQSRWYIPPRKSSTGSTTAVESDSSSDSD
ncbi:hypothetical protein BD414DRAFT_532505 [Trametes punicea]|nr:hypothetical protein BD414DRAFT_532505 [Trametes punicea]